MSRNVPGFVFHEQHAYGSQRVRHERAIFSTVAKSYLWGAVSRLFVSVSIGYGQYYGLKPVSKMNYSTSKSNLPRAYGHVESCFPRSEGRLARNLQRAGY